MPTSGRDSYHHGALREAVLSAALELLLDRGADGLSLREVARRLGVSHNAPRKHFGTREALLAALAERGFETLADAIAASGKKASGDPGVARGLAYVDFALKTPALFRLMFSGAIDRTAYPSLQAAAAAGLAELCEFVGETYGEDALDEATISAWAFVHGLAQLLLDDQIPGSSRAAKREFARRTLVAMSAALRN